MKKKEVCVKTKRMMIQMMSDEEIDNLIETSGSDELRTAYREMLSGCKHDPDNRIWYALWKVMLKEDDTYIGTLSFKGPAKDNVVEIRYGILSDQEGKGYATEAVQAMTQWAFGNADVVFIEAETEPENRAAQRVLEKCGFVPDGEGQEGLRFVLEKPLTSWMAIYMLFGISIGTTLGTSLGNVGIGISLGLCFGISIGAALDSSAKKERKKFLEQREDRRQKHLKHT